VDTAMPNVGDHMTVTIILVGSGFAGTQGSIIAGAGIDTLRTQDKTAGGTAVTNPHQLSAVGQVALIEVHIFRITGDSVIAHLAKVAEF
jgi:hypothetical protein